MKSFKAWVAAHNISSHTFVGLLVSATGAYMTVPQIKDAIDALAAKSKWGTAGVALLLYAAAKYSHGHNSQQ